MLGGDPVRDRDGELPVVRPHVRRESAPVAAHHRPDHLRAQVLLPAQTPLAPHARATESPDADLLTDRQPIDFRSDRRDDPDRLIPGHQRMLRYLPVVVEPAGGFLSPNFPKYPLFSRNVPDYESLSPFFPPLSPFIKMSPLLSRQVPFFHLYPLFRRNVPESPKKLPGSI